MPQYTADVFPNDLHTAHDGGNDGKPLLEVIALFYQRGLLLSQFLERWIVSVWEAFSKYLVGFLKGLD